MVEAHRAESKRGERERGREGEREK